MVGEFNLPEEIIDRKVRKMKMISPSNREVDVGQTLGDDEYIGMVRREVLDDFLRQRAKKNGATVINGLTKKVVPSTDGEGPIKVIYNNYTDKDGTVNRLPSDRCVTGFRGRSALKAS